MESNLASNDINDNTKYLESSNQSINDQQVQRNDTLSPVMIKTYKYRFLILILFTIFSATNAFHWIQYAIIDSSIQKYYETTSFWVNCTSTIYMLIYIIGIIPATYIFDRYGLRNCLIIGSFGNALGSLVKCFSVDPSRFWVIMIGQTIIATSQLFILSIPPLLAATWFPVKEVSIATSVGVFGNQVGIALGFFIPPHLMPDVEEKETIKNGLWLISISLAIITSLIFLLIMIFFKKQPKCPPSNAQALIRNLNESKEKMSHFQTIKTLISNINYDLLVISYGLNAGVFYALSTVLNQIVVNVFGEKYQTQAGNMGGIMILGGIIGSIAFGFLLRWLSKYFKLVVFIVYLFTGLGIVAFTAIIYIDQFNDILMYICSFLLGFFMTGYLPMGFDFAAELTYPCPEGLSSGFLNASAQVCI